MYIGHDLGLTMKSSSIIVVPIKQKRTDASCRIITVFNYAKRESKQAHHHASTFKGRHNPKMA